MTRLPGSGFNAVLDLLAERYGARCFAQRTADTDLDALRELLEQAGATVPAGSVLDGRGFIGSAQEAAVAWRAAELLLPEVGGQWVLTPVSANTLPVSRPEADPTFSPDAMGAARLFGAVLADGRQVWYQLGDWIVIRPCST